MNLNRKKEGEIRFRTKELQLKNEVVPEFDLRPMLLVFFGRLWAKLLGVDSSRALSSLSDQGQLVSNGLIKIKAPCRDALITLPEIGSVAFEILSNPITGGACPRF